MKRIIFILVLSLFIAPAAGAATLAEDTAGKILLQVERNGEAWYVHPINHERHFLFRPLQAYQVMREQGIGITNDDLAKIPIGFYEISGDDRDGDGLADTFEEALGSNPAEADSDGDGYDDKTEIINGYNPIGSNGINIDMNFSKAQKGKIFLQVERSGEAWWVNPDDYRRYYLGRPEDAYSLMRSFGLGITNSNLEKIPITDVQMDCGNDFEECFVVATEVDQPSKAIWVALTRLFGLDYATVESLQIQAPDSEGKYLYEQKINTVDVTITDENYELALESGKSPEEIDYMLECAQEGAHSSEDTIMRCRYTDQEAMVEVLHRWQDQNYSSEDFSFAECETIEP